VKRRPSFFSGYCHENGVRRRLRREEIQEARRLYSKHWDIRAGKVKPECWGALPLGERP
jgi:hypothetical protein